MNIALIFAGGVGQRMNSKTKPKQFLELHGKPIIIYTLEHFENHSDIDGIVVVCVKEWTEYLEKLLEKFHIKKVSAIVEGGETGQGSIRNGVYKINELYPEDSVILIHDGVRPLIDENVITNNIECVKKFGNSITVTPAIETVTLCSDDKSNDVAEVLDRNRCMLARAPQCFILKDIFSAHQKAVEEGFENAVDSAMLMRHYGWKLHTTVGSPENIKITTPSDFYIFRAIIDAKENSQIFG